jgi:hypothetical protein
MMMSGLVVESATLRTGAYPRRHDDRLGAELDVSLREGSRSEFGIRGAVGGAHAVLAAEGPLGGADATGFARGSWLLSARQSFLEWPPERSSSSRTPFGFSDGLARIVFDVKPTQQFTLTAMGGVSSVDGEEDDLPSSELGDGATEASVLSVAWRSTVRPAFVVTQQASVVTQRYWNDAPTGEKSDGGGNQALAYRAAVSRPTVGGLLEAGALIERITTKQTFRGLEAGLVAGSSWRRSAFAHFSWAASPSVTVSPGVRLTWSTLLRRPVASRWVLSRWAFWPGWSVIASAGASRQPPELAYILGHDYVRELRPERAAHVEVGLDRQLAAGVRFQVTLFQRSEADLIQSPDVYTSLTDDGFAVHPSAGAYANALRGSSRGLELLVTRRSPRGLSGWASYAYGRTQYTDTTSGETFWADFDQRHTFNLFARHRFSTRTGVGATFRAGSNFPIPGYLAERSGHLVAGMARNQVRLPLYARLDVRADHQVTYFGRTFTLFVEALNALNRANVGAVRGSIEPATGEALGFKDRLLPRRVSAGVVFEF